MPKRIIEFFVVDILIALDRIKRYSLNYSTIDDFFEDEKNFSAVTREFEIIGEAMKHILSIPDLNHRANKQWRSIIDFRNRITHDYFGLDEEEVFRIAQEEILIFEAELIEFIKLIDRNGLLAALCASKNDLKRHKLNKSIAYLKTIETMLEN